MPKFKPGQSGNPRGRPPKAEKYKKQFGQADRFLAEQLLANLAGLQALANGGYERVEDKYLPAALVTTGSGEYESLVFPDLPKGELVLVERKRSLADRDRAALINLLDRFLGRPTTPIEGSDGNGGPLFKVYVGIDPDNV